MALASSTTKVLLISKRDAADPNVEGVLTRVLNAFVKALCAPNRQSPIRAVIAIADRMQRLCGKLGTESRWNEERRCLEIFVKKEEKVTSEKQ